MTLRTTVLDMQPIDPPVGGGRLRLLGLYHGLGHGHRAHYVGTYDWRGPGARKQQLTPTLLEELVPLTEAHFTASDRRAQDLGGKGVIDTAFHTMAHLSPDYVEAARRAAREADVVVFSHPWIYPLVRDVLQPDRQLIVYDAHNVEGLLRTELLDDGGAGSAVARGVVEVESAVCRAADLILACSHEDREAFANLYGVSAGRIRVVPNGTFTRQIVPPSIEEKHAVRQRLGAEGRPVAFFLGSKYGPNVAAARFIAEALAPALPGVLFVIAGGVGDGLEDMTLPANVRVTGQISEEDKIAWLQASNVAVNPMFSGSGTNIKMLDFMAAGLPIVSTEIGARGIETSERAFAIAHAENFAQTIRTLLDNPADMAALGDGARAQADRFYSWERISDSLGALLARWAVPKREGREPPFFSVIVPTYERHTLLTKLAGYLSLQTWRDFEVIMVDQSAEPWPDRDRDFGFDLLYIHTDRKGAVTARNTGAALARGRVIAFTDDDCEPHEGWLANAHECFSTSDIVGLEGLITSGRAGDPNWRGVTNDGFEGIGFMTANLFVRADVFHAINGFDIALEKPHFREDTDLGWRLQEVGEVPFSRGAWVYHPPHPRSVERESLEVRSKFFLNDAILLRKHPDRYADLLLREVQWVHNPHFWDYFLKGVELHGVNVPEPVRQIMHDNAGITYTGLLGAGVGAADAPAHPVESAQVVHAPAHALHVELRDASLRSSLRRSISWTVRPVWRRIWARIEGRVRPVDQKVDAIHQALSDLRHETTERLREIDARIEALDTRIGAVLDKVPARGPAQGAANGEALSAEAEEVLRAARLVLRQHSSALAAVGHHLDSDDEAAERRAQSVQTVQPTR
ncbi:glycosyltransferase [Pseudochelatococcus lubricantis]|uniref:glycosyltransferase n=1 Tax=Pseudochelatococcus lubricantis TaxID=1538102 RepID=UPI0035EA3623